MNYADTIDLFLHQAHTHTQMCLWWQNSKRFSFLKAWIYVARHMDTESSIVLGEKSIHSLSPGVLYLLFKVCFYDLFHMTRQRWVQSSLIMICKRSFINPEPKSVCISFSRFYIIEHHWKWMGPFKRQFGVSHQITVKYHHFTSMQMPTKDLTIWLRNLKWSALQKAP